MQIISKCQMWSQLMGLWFNWSITSIHISTEDDAVIILSDKYETHFVHLLSSQLLFEQIRLLC